MGGQRLAPAALDLGKTRYPQYSMLRGPQGRSGQAWKISCHRDSIPDRSTHSESLYRLSYPESFDDYDDDDDNNNNNNNNNNNTVILN
jgi:hypothetical protein